MYAHMPINSLFFLFLEGRLISIQAPPLMHSVCNDNYYLSIKVHYNQPSQLFIIHNMNLVVTRYRYVGRPVTVHTRFMCDAHTQTVRYVQLTFDFPQKSTTILGSSSEPNNL